MFEKIVVVDSTGLNTWGVERLKEQIGRAHV